MAAEETTADQVRRCRCGTRLARDNRGERCHACVRAARNQLVEPPLVAETFWQTPQLRAALATCEIGEVIRAFRTHPAHGRGYPQATAAAWLGISQPRLSRIENGEQIVNLTKLTRWARTLRIPEHLLWFHTPSARSPGSVAPRLPQPADAASSHESLVPLGSISERDRMSPLSRRHLLGGTAAVALARHLPISPQAAGQPAGASWAGGIASAVLDPVDAARTATLQPTPPDRSLHDRVRRAMTASLASDYRDLASRLPRLIGQAEAACLTCRHGYEELQRLLCDIYTTAAWTLIKADDPATAWVAAQRAIHLAERAGDRLRLAAATRCLAEVHMRDHRYEDATRTALLATVHLDTAHPDDRDAALCLRGAALLSAAAAAARRADGREAYAALTAAARCAEALGADRTELATVFGPTNVAIHQVAVAVELGNHSGALDHIPTVRLKQIPAHLAERRARFLIDVARAHTLANDHSSATQALLQAEHIAADELRQHRLTRQLLPHLLRHQPPSSGIRPLAQRCNIPH